MFRVWRLFDNPKLRKVVFTNVTLLKHVLMVIAVDAVILGLWTGMSKPVSQNETTNIVGVGQVTRKLCMSENTTFSSIAMLYKVNLDNACDKSTRLTS